MKHTINCITNYLLFYDIGITLKNLFTTMTREYSSQYYKCTPGVDLFQCVCSLYGKHVLVLSAEISKDSFSRVSAYVLPNAVIPPSTVSYEMQDFISKAVTYSRGASIEDIQKRSNNGVFVMDV